MQLEQEKETGTFSDVKKLVANRFEKMVKSGRTLFKVEYNRDEIWEAYHSAFTTPERQQSNMCNACKSFIRAVGGMISINPVSLEVETLWDQRGKEVPDEYLLPLASLDAYVRNLPIAGLFYHTEPSAGVDKNADKERDVIWYHFHAKIPSNMLDRGGDKLRESANLRDDRNVLERGIKELTPDAMQTVIELIDQNTLYRGPEYRHIVEGLQKAQKEFQDVPAPDQDKWLWVRAKQLGSAACRARNTAIGTLLIDLSEGRDLEGAVTAYERVTAPANYKRPTALVTPRMVENAKEKLKDLNLMDALDRRRLDSRDLTVADALFVYRPKSTSKDVFASLTEDTPVTPKSLDRVEDISVSDFIANVLPHAEKMRVLFERHLLGNLVCLTGPQNPEAKSLMKWDNSFGWSYSGGVADGIKERVKRAGGRVDDVWMRSSLSWSNHDDLDLHMYGNNGMHVYFGDKVSRNGNVHLDVDANAYHLTREPVENIYCKKQLPKGKYCVSVHNYNKRETHEEGFELEIEVNGEVRTFGSLKNPKGKNQEDIKFEVMVDGSIKWEDSPLAKSASGVVKWGLKTGQFHTVRALTTSPNHWTKPVGNKHLFFLLEGCVADERIRPFYNEFLTEELAADRKVCEVLAGKIEVAEADGAELSGLGFSETVRNHLFVEVDGKFKRTLKVLF